MLVIITWLSIYHTATDYAFVKAWGLSIPLQLVILNSRRILSGCIQAFSHLRNLEFHIVGYMYGLVTVQYLFMSLRQSQSLSFYPRSSLVYSSLQFTIGWFEHLSGSGWVMTILVRKKMSTLCHSVTVVQPVHFWLCQCPHWQCV